MDEVLRSFFFPLTFTLDIYGAKHIDGYEAEAVTVNSLEEAYEHVEGMVDWALSRRLSGGWDLESCAFPGEMGSKMAAPDGDQDTILDMLARAIDGEDEGILRLLRDEMTK